MRGRDRERERGVCACSCVYARAREPMCKRTRVEVFEKLQNSQ
jgi:hypothetical protein